MVKITQMKKTTLRQVAMHLALLLFVVLAPLGLRAQETITLNGNVSQTIEYGTTYLFYDNGGPDANYGTNQNYTATFTSNGVIIINFSQFATESASSCANWDYMLIYDGDATSGTLLARGQTGCATSSIDVYTDIVAESGTMTIEWHSDNSTTAAGWVATITSTPPTSCAKPVALTPTLTMGDGSIATLSWTAGGTETAWVLEYGTAIDFAGATSVEVSGTPSASLTGLTPETPYYARVKAVCGGDDGESQWSTTATFTPSDAYFLTVNDGTTTNEYVPVYGYYCDNYSRSQFIIPATALTDMQWGSITKLTFYSSNSSQNWGNASFKVYFTETDATTLSALADWNTLNEAYEGSLSISGNKMEVTLTNPYQYTGGGNLLIGINQTVTGSYHSASFYGVSATGASMGGHDNSVSQQNFLPKTTFKYIPGVAPTCYKPTATSVDAYDQTTATLSWTPDERNQEGGSYSIVWVTADAGDVVLNANSTPAATISGTTATISGLNENTEYSFKVKTNCAEQETVEDVEFPAFTTLANCPIPSNPMADDITAHSAVISWTGYDNDSYNIRYQIPNGQNQDFENGSMPEGWTSEGNGAWTVGTGDYSVSTGSHSGSYNAKINHSSNGNITYLVTPAMDLSTVSEASLSLWYINRAWSGDKDGFGVCYRVDGGEWIELFSTNDAHESWTQLNLNLSGLAANYQLGFRMTDAYGYGVSVDDIEVVVPNDEWSETSSAATSTTLSGLNAKTTYNVQVQGVCGNDMSEWSTLVSFTTTAGNVTPSQPTVANITTTTAVVSWTGAVVNTLHEYFDLYYSATESVPPTDVTNTTPGFISGVTSPYTLTDLTPSTIYKVWVRDYCGNDGISVWSIAATFPTACEAITANGYVENFDSYTAGNNVLPICWNYINTTTYNSNSIYPKLYSYSYNSSPNSLGLLSSYSSSSDYDPQPQYAILPEMNGLGGMRLTLMARGYNTSSTFKVGTMSNPADATTFNEVAEQTDLTTSYQTFTFDIPTNTTDRYLAIMIDAANSDRNSNGIYIDNLSIIPTPSCEMPTGLSLMDEALSYDQAQIAFETSVSGESNWDLYLSTNAEAPTAGTAPTATVDSYQPLLTGLAVQTTYHVWVRARCNDNDFSAWVGPLQFTTTAVPTVVGDAWNDDFEGNSCDWDLINGTLTNAWAWGSETNNGGNNALYVSNNGGTTYEYTNTSSTMVYAAKLLTFAQSKYIFEYDWNGNGESNYDYLRVALVPASESLTAGTIAPSGFGAAALPTGWIALDGGSKLNLATSWQNKSVAVNVPAAGNYYLVLAWRNDNGGGSNPPAAVDNVSVTRVTCPYDVDGLTVDDASITTTSASVSWTAGEASEWQVAFKNANDDDWTILPSTCTSASATLTGLTPSSVYMVRARVYCNADDQGVWCDPETFATECDVMTANGYTENFDGYTAGDNVLPNCWNYINTCTNSSYNIFPRVYSYSSNSTPNNLQLYSYFSSWSSSYDPQPQYAILPEMDDLSGMRLTLMAKGSNANSTFKVGTMSDPADATTFNEVAEQTGLTTSYQTFTFDIPEGTADRHLVIMIDAANTNRSTNAVFIDDISIAPTPSCLEPTGLQLLAVETNDAQITWTAGGSEQLWDLYWSTSNEAPTAETTPTVSGTNNQQPWMNGSLQPATTYYVWVRAHCSGEDLSAWTGPGTFTTECEAFTIPFIEDFENGINCWSLVDCASSTGVQSTYPVSGTKSFKFNYNTNPPQYLISPQLSGVEEGTLVSFMYRPGNSYTESFALGYSTTTADVDAFTWFDEQTDLNTRHYQKYSETLPAGVKYLAVKYTANDQLALYIDDFKVFVPTTVQKEVQANKWYAIATPIADPAVADVQNLTNGAAYDLYAWDEGNGQWSAPASLTAGKGYIYRRAEATTLSFTGEANTGNFTVDVTASCPDNSLKGFNLVGNPYTEAISRTNVYQLDQNGSWTVAANATIAPTEGFMVYTEATGTESFTEPTGAKGTPTATESLMFTLKNGTFKDVAYARFGSQSAMPKLGHLNAAAPVLSIPVDGRSYAIAQLADDCEQFDLAFRGAEGDYTISLGNATTAFAYIHLIDRLTGRDIDLLRQPSYSFSHSGLGTTANRFAVKLRPAADEATGDAFARWNGTNWEVEGSGKLQVFDVVGRPLFGTEVDRQTTIDNAVFPAAGVYILRLGDKTQKIVVK